MPKAQFVKGARRNSNNMVAKLPKSLKPATEHQDKTGVNDVVHSVNELCLTKKGQRGQISHAVLGTGIPARTKLHCRPEFSTSQLTQTDYDTRILVERNIISELKMPSEVKLDNRDRSHFNDAGKVLYHIYVRKPKDGVADVAFHLKLLQKAVGSMSAARSAMDMSRGGVNFSAYLTDDDVDKLEDMDEVYIVSGPSAGGKLEYL